MESHIYQGLARIEDTHWWYVGRRAIIERLVPAPAAAEGKAVLSVGCGTGSEMAFLGRYGTVTGIDADRSAVDFCAAHGHATNVVLGSAEKLPFSDGAFDFVFALDVLEHLGDEVAGVREAWRVLKAGGVFVVTVPAMPWLWSPADARAHHLRRYTKPRLAALLTGQGIHPERLSYFNTLLFPLVAAVKLATHVFEPRSAASAEVGLPPPGINRILKNIFSSERALLARFNLPFGVSIVAVARKGM